MASFQAAVRYFTSNDLWQNAGALFPEQQTCKNDTYKLNGIAPQQQMDVDGVFINEANFPSELMPPDKGLHFSYFHKAPR